MLVILIYHHNNKIRRAIATTLIRYSSSSKSSCCSSSSFFLLRPSSSFRFLLFLSNQIRIHTSSFHLKYQYSNISSIANKVVKSLSQHHHHHHHHRSHPSNIQNVLISLMVRRQKIQRFCLMLTYSGIQDCMLCRRPPSPGPSATSSYCSCGKWEQVCSTCVSFGFFAE